MIDRKQASLLLREHWHSPTHLAAALFQMAASRQPRTVDAPVTISVPKGQLAFRVSSVPPQPTPAARTSSVVSRPAPAAETIPSDNLSLARPEPPSIRPKSEPPASGLRFTPDELQTQRDARGVPERPSPTQVSPSALPVFLDAASAAPANVYRSAPAPATPEVAFAAFRSGDLPALLDAPPPKPFVAERPESRVAGPGTLDLGFSVPTPAPSRPPLEVLGRPQPLMVPGPRPFSPLVELDGPVAFSSAEPSRFEAMPEVWSPGRRQYEPISEWATEQMARLMMGTRQYRPLIGKVVSGYPGENRWRCTLWREAAPYMGSSDPREFEDHSFEADVLVIGDPNALPIEPPIGFYVGPVVELPSPTGAPDNDFLLVSPQPSGARIARTTSLITAGTASRQGTGSVMLLIAAPGVDYVDDVAATVFNTNDQVPDDTIVQTKMVGSMRFIDVARC
jgi:hypothetical protein